MSCFGAVMRWFTAILFAAFVLPAAAAGTDKLFSISASPGNLPPGQNVVVTVTFRNDSPGGNSIINSVKLVAPAAFSGVSASSGTASPSSGNAGDTISINNVSGVRPGKTLTVTMTMTVPPTATCTLITFTGSAWTGNSFGGDSFAPSSLNANLASVGYGCDGVLPCGGSFVKADGSAGQLDPGYATSSRSSYNKDGTTTGNGCVAVPYSFTNTILSNNLTYLKWLLQPTAVFTTTVNGQLRPVEADGTVLAGQPQVAWLTDPSSPGTPVFIKGPACLGTNPATQVPNPYGTLQTQITASSTPPFNITINPTVLALPAVNRLIPIVIGTERMEAKVLSATSLQINTRQSGGTPLQAHSVNDPVMSTPLPLLVAPTGGFTPQQAAAGYATGLQAQMCVLESGWSAYGVDANGVAQIYDFTTVIDIGDGWVLPK